MIYTLAILITLLQFADYWLTMRILARGGTELNPVMAKLMSIFGRQAGLLIGKLYAAVFVLAGAYRGWFESDEGLLILIILAGVYSWVVWHNLRQYRRGVA